MTTATGTCRTGRVRRVAGSLIEVVDLPGLAIAEIVDLGTGRLPGEVVALTDEVATVQAYEYTGGLAPGAPVLARGEPLVAPLGPGLLGSVTDGLLRPLSEAGPWLLPTRPPVTEARRWQVTCSAADGDLVSPGFVVATVDVPGPLEFRVQVPPGVRGRLRDVVASGEHPEDAVLAQVVDADGIEHPLTMVQRWPVRHARPYADRIDDASGLVTGQRALDLLYPVARGSTAAVPGGFGTGKTMLLQQVAKWCDADVIVYVGCGERGNEMADVVADLAELDDPRTGAPLAQRTVVIANTSNMAMMAREASIYSGITVAEFFRDMGYHTVVIADSTSRWAEALREFASSSGALPAEEGYPADLASSLAAFYERAGHVQTLGGSSGSVTVLGAVSPPGGDRTEPVTANTERFVRCVWSLDRDLAYARHYPAVSWTGSFSRDAAELGTWHTRTGDPGWAGRRAKVLALLADADRLSALAELVGIGSLPAAERVVILGARLVREAVLQQNALSAVDASCTAQKGSALVTAVLDVVTRCQTLVDRDVLASTIEEQDYSALVRAREETEADDVAGVFLRRDTVLAALDSLDGTGDEAGDGHAAREAP
ncbi:MAG: V-type ATP synthase subunit A [Jiangellales bacterium]